MYQDIIWTVALIAMGLIALGFLWVISQAGKVADAASSDRTHHRANVLRRWLFGALLVVFAGVTWASLHRFPIPRQHGTLDAQQAVDVIGRQWSWEMSATTLTTGTPVEFRVTSDDVNHGFAIYAPDGRIVTQTQAMPGYTNRILYTFTEPGTYSVMCLEYCGLGHAPMAGEIQVVAAEEN
ncbi:MAG: cytochrome oxidase [Steroidobacteraceae bacterium]